MIMEIVMDTIHDTWLMLPLLYLTYLIIEYFDRKESEDDKLFFSLQKYGPLVGALVGVIPQCGFSIIAAMLFMGNNITLGTLLSVLIATSDEAIPILLANPGLYSSLLLIIMWKVGIAVAAGYFVDKVLFRKQNIRRLENLPEDEYEEEDENTNTCPCCYPQYPMAISALLRAVKIFVFLFITTLVLNILITGIGEERLESLLLNGTILQPLLAALFGFLPNCAASVVLTQLYVVNSISFASLVAGLITNAGLGIIVLVRYQAKKKQIIQVVSLLYLTAAISGIVLQIFT